MHFPTSSFCQQCYFFPICTIIRHQNSSHSHILWKRTHLVLYIFPFLGGQFSTDLHHTVMETRNVCSKISSCTSSSWRTQEVLEGGGGGGAAYPSSLRFTAHSSISPKTSKRRFSSVRVQSDLSRPTYTTRLSSCSLRGDTDREAGGRLKEWECVFFSSHSFNELVLITPVDTAAFTDPLTPCIFLHIPLLSVCPLCSSVIGSAFSPLSEGGADGVPSICTFFLSFPLRFIREKLRIFFFS